ncbi:hypothetical protein CF651_30290 [Paenibacillus rigui]|uniref:SLH domain-containing protein n=2 Tax=Paenibacillus rigui TaxID=554312 RepID=A0A229UGS2_9BACL|nr:hypothetical protein CF651_30290 [Paenibacillus rigui]
MLHKGRPFLLPLLGIHSMLWWRALFGVFTIVYSLNKLAAAYEAGLVDGVDAEGFAPQANISRQDLTVMLARAVDLLHIAKKSGSVHVPYTDATGFAPYAADSIQKVTESGLMSGVELKGSTYFLPTDPTTREAAAMVLYSLLQNGKLIN